MLERIAGERKTVISLLHRIASDDQNPQPPYCAPAQIVVLSGSMESHRVAIEASPLTGLSI